jgi:signal peptidase I
VWTVGVAVLVSLLVKMFVIQAFLIPSSSMENTLRINDRVLTNRLAYEVHDIHRGDIVVFSGAGTWNGPAPTPPSTLIGRWWHDLAVRAGVDSADGTIYVKRVIGLPGDTVACCNAHGQVTVNGIALDEASYVDQDSYWNGKCPHPDNGISPRCFGPVKIQAGMLWVMGDHRAVSEDSRRHLDAPGGGAVLESRVVGKAVLVLWPASHLRTLGTPTTFAGIPAVAMVMLPMYRRRRRRAAGS